MIKFEITWILIHISTDRDYQTSYLLIDESLGLMNTLNKLLEEFGDNIKSNVVWILSNIIGEKRSDIVSIVLAKSYLLDFLAGLMNSHHIHPILLNHLPWACSNILDNYKSLTYEQVSPPPSSVSRFKLCSEP